MSQVQATPVIEKVWKPNSGKQELYLSLPDTIFEQFYGGAAGGGKSEALLMRPVLRQWTDSPGFKALILRRTYKELEESLIQRSQIGKMNADGTEIPSFNDLGATYNEQKKRWRFASGATISFGHAENEEDVRKYDTAEYQYVGFDELTSFTEFQYKFIAFSRVRSSIPGIPAIVCSASNPGNVGHRWVRERFVEHCPQGGKILAERIKDGLEERLIKRIFIQAFLTDNPRLMENDPLYKFRLELLPEADKRAKLYGDWWTFAGQVFGEWRNEPFADEPANACHVIPPYVPDVRLPRVLAIDWGYQAMTYCLWGVPFSNKRAVIYKEYTPNPTNEKEKKEFGELDSKTVKAWTTHIANECLMEGINPYIVLDPSAWQNRGTGTIAEQFEATWREVMGRNPRLEKADNDRIGGKLLVHDYLRWKPRPKYNIAPTESYNRELAEWIFRNKGLDAHKAYLSQFVQKPENVDEVIPLLQVTSNCKILIKTIPLCVYSDKESNIEDVKEFRGDDPYDDLRYLLKKLNKMNVAELTQLPSEVDGQVTDWNKYYRQLEIAQVKATEKKQAVILMGRASGRRRR